MKIKNKVKKGIYHILVFGFGLVMLYPLFWMFMSSFKESSTIFTTAGQIIPEKFMITNYINGWKGFAGISFGTFFQKFSVYFCFSNCGNADVLCFSCLWIFQM